MLVHAVKNMPFTCKNERDNLCRHSCNNLLHASGMCPIPFTDLPHVGKIYTEHATMKLLHESLRLSLSAGIKIEVNYSEKYLS
jgi:hypothetical protein